MNTTSALVSKVDAARRQIDASIKMFLSSIDPLAVHTVAGAATKLLEELHKRRSRNPIQEQLASGMMHAVREYLRGNRLTPERVRFAQLITAQMTVDQKEHLAKRDISDADVSYIASGIPKDVSDQVRNRLFKTVNFLKHS